MTVKETGKTASVHDELQGQLFLECLKILGAINKRNKIQGLVVNSLAHAINVARRSHTDEKTKRQETLNKAFGRVRDAAANLLTAMRDLDTEALDFLRKSVEGSVEDRSHEMEDWALFGMIVSNIKRLKSAAIHNIAPQSKGRKRAGGKLLTVFYAQELFINCRADKPTNYDGGDFVQLCRLIWEIATGEHEAEFKRQIRHVLSNNLRFAPVCSGQKSAKKN